MKRILSCLMILTLCFSICSCSPAKKGIREDEIITICELATVKCYYNNVAKISKDKDNILQKDRKMWIEYEGEAVIGIDMSKAKISISDTVITIALPQAEVLSYSIVPDSFNYVSSADGWLFKNKITAEDEQTAIEAAQTAMKKDVEGNKTVFVLAEKRAKELIENYIDTVGEQAEIPYTIRWKTA